MPRPFAVFLCLLLLVGCDSADDPTEDTALFSVVVETPSGEPASGLSLSVDYALVGADGDERAVAPVVLRFFEVTPLPGHRFRVEWETKEEETAFGFGVEARRVGEEDFDEATYVAPQGANVLYSVEVEGEYEAFRLRIEDTVGELTYSEVVEVEGEADPPALPGSFRFATNFPNPFSSRGTTFFFDLAEPGAVRLEVLDLDGRLVEVVADTSFQAGSAAVFWRPGEELAGGIFRARLTTADTSASVLTAYTGPEIDISTTPLRIRTALGQTDETGRFATDDRSLFPQRYEGIEAEFRDENNVDLGTFQPADAMTIILRDGAGREQRYERLLDGKSNAFELTWDAE